MLNPEHAGIPSRTDGPSEQPTSATRSHVYVNVSKSACAASFSIPSHLSMSLPLEDITGGSNLTVSRQLSRFPRHSKVKFR